MPRRPTLVLVLLLVLALGACGHSPQAAAATEDGR
jgi:hypothetical protein